MQEGSLVGLRSEMTNFVVSLAFFALFFLVTNMTKSILTRIFLIGRSELQFLCYAASQPLILGYTHEIESYSGEHM